MPDHTDAIPMAAQSLHRAERRQVTLLFCDLVESTRLSRLLDPEELHDLLDSYRSACADVVRHYQGLLTRTIGDGLLVCFGYPAAHEDDVERALAAGLDLLDAVARLARRSPLEHTRGLRVRIGVATGLVVAGDLVAPSEGGEPAIERDVISGEAANLASRLQALADPGAVVISADTRRLAGERFDYRPLGTHNLKGFDEPIAAFQLVADRGLTRFEGRSPASPPIVGREAELARLLHAWQRTLAGHGQLVLVSGEAGIGKSCLAAELRHRVAPAATFVLQCSPHHANAPLYPFVRHLERLAGIGRADPAAERLAKLAALLRPHPDSERLLPLLAALPGLVPSEAQPAPLEPPAPAHAQRERTIAALADWIAARVSAEPPLLVVEDVQWLDPTSRALLLRLADWARAAPALLLLTVRAEPGQDPARFPHELGLPPDAAETAVLMPLRELSPADARRLACAASDAAALSEAQIQAVIDRSERIPLFIEELAKAVAAGLRLAPAKPAAPLDTSIPDSLRDALMAQLDGLGPARELAQAAAVIGPDFSADLLARILARAAADIEPALDSLLVANLIVAAGSEGQYRFRHALLRDIAYQSSLRSVRARLHRRVADELAALPDPTTRDRAAQHFSLANEPRRAIECWQQAAHDAIARSAHEEALGMLRAALAEFAKLPDPAPRGLELALVLAMASPLRAIHGYSAPEVEERLEQARALCLAENDRAKRFDTEFALFQCTLVKNDIGRAHELARGLLSLAAADPALPAVDAYLANGMVSVQLGRYRDALVFLERGIAVSDLEHDPPRFLTHGQNPGLFCLSYLARSLCLCGRLDTGLALMAGGLAVAERRARDPGHTYGYVNVLIHAARVHHLRGDLDEEERFALHAIDVARRNHYGYYTALATAHLGWVAGQRGDLETGIARLREAIDTLSGINTELARLGFYVLLAELHLRHGQPAQARSAIDLVCERAGCNRVWDPDIPRIRGDILLAEAPANAEPPLAAYRASQRIAVEQGAKTLVLRAAMSQAQLLARLGRGGEAGAALATGLDHLPEPSGASVVREAINLRDALAHPGLPAAP